MRHYILFCITTRGTGDAVEKAFNAGTESDASIFLNPIISSEEEKRMRQKVEEHIKTLQAAGE